MNPLHNDEQSPDRPLSSGNDTQPTEEPTLINETPTDKDQTFQEPAPKLEPPAEEKTSVTSDETVIPAELAKDEDKTLQEPAPMLEPPAEEKTSVASDETVIPTEPAKDEDKTLQEPASMLELPAEEKTITDADEPTLGPEKIEIAETLNQAPTQEVSANESAANQDTNETPQPPMNPEAFPHDVRSTPEGMWQSYPPPAPPPMWQSYPPPATPPMWQSYPPPAVPTRPKQLSRLARPLPLWASLGGVVLIVVLLVILHLTGSDWGNGAANASEAAVFIGIILFLALIVRSLNWNNSSGMASPLNPTRVRQYITSLLCIIVIFVYSGVSGALVPTLHIAQGRSLEGQQQWPAAINEYKLGGEAAPGGEDLARAYTLWGLALNKAQRYDEAMTKFETVIGQFNSTTTGDQVKQAQIGDIKARLALAQQNMQGKYYGTATNSYDSILLLSYCDTTCTNQVDALDATAYYNLGEEDLQTKAYTDAVSAFDTVLTKFSSAPEAKQLHGDMAKALLGEGQNTRASNCTSAIPTYQRLANEYGDTPEGQSAAQDLNAPQTITGNFTNANPSDATIQFTQMGLTQGLHAGMSTDDLVNAWQNAGQKTDIQSNGAFSFSGIPQGTYDLFWYGTSTTSDATYIYIYQYVEFIYSPISSQPEYVANVGPLCPVDMGKVTNSTGFSPFVPLPPIPPLQSQ